MGMSEISTWVLIRRYDRLETDAGKLQSSLHRLTLTSSISFDELRAIFFRLIAVEDDGSRVLKIRRYDNNLIPLSTLLNGSERDKYEVSAKLTRLIFIARTCPVERRTILSGYIDALKTKFSNLEKRVLLAERALPEITTAHIQAVEEATSQLANCVSFLDRRLDELAPPDWRTQIPVMASK